ncbi:hypothetical protein AVEN_93712-1 [Araneus ventricosus]|uniref:Uncharacterized protein n=1 Tax=Araneus ventricosus TaxID=182803 RepID=A0A4Y2T014_ARAVE|nr:hypothetical protein AVEN_93712-1 [Araneus ventricosus]
MTCTEVNIATVNRKRRPVLMEIGCDTMPSFVAMSRRTTTQLYNKAGAKLRAGKESGCRWGWSRKVGQTIRGVLVGKKESSARIFQCSAMARLAKVIFCLIALSSMEADCILLKKTKKVISYVPQHRTLKLQDTRQDREQHHETSTHTRMTERHHGKKMAPVAPPTIERRRQLIVTATQRK